MQTNATYSKTTKPAKQWQGNADKANKGNKPVKHDKRQQWQTA